LAATSKAATVSRVQAVLASPPPTGSTFQDDGVVTQLRSTPTDIGNPLVSIGLRRPAVTRMYHSGARYPNFTMTIAWNGLAAATEWTLSAEAVSGLGPVDFVETIAEGVLPAWPP
jgi:hypothetical protein